MSTLLERAEMIARRAHASQFRRDGVTPYIEHPRAVVAKLANESEEVRAVAWLHDVLEDTEETPSSLYEAAIPTMVVDAVLCLTKQELDTYDDYLQRVKENPIARKVKIADMLHNLSDAPTERQIIKYAKGLLFLHGARP